MAYVGKMACTLCGSPAVVTHTKGGARSVRCAPPCGFSGYVQPGNSKGVRLFDAKVTPDQDDEAAPPAPAKKSATLMG